MLFHSCQKEDSDAKEVIGIILEDTEKYFDTNILGKVQDDNAVDLNNVTVSVGDKVDFTSDLGVFIFNNIRTNSAGSLIKLSKKGYFDHYVFIVKDAGQYTNIYGTLNRKEGHQLLSSAVENEIKVNENLSLVVPPDAFIDISSNIYHGQVKFYMNQGAVQGNIPFVDTKLKKGMLTKSNSVQFVFETPDGAALTLNQPSFLKTTLNDISIGQLDLKKEKWYEKPKIIENSFLKYHIKDQSPIIFGSKSEMTKIKTRIVSPDQQGVAFAQIEATTDQDTWTFNPDQNGYLSFYAPTSSNLRLTAMSADGHILAKRTTYIGTDSEQAIPPITISETDLVAIKSDIVSCDAPISNYDLVNLSLTGGNKTIHVYQSQNQQTFVMPTFHKIEKAKYYRGKQQKFSLSFSGYQSPKLVHVSAAPLCMENISGYININDLLRFFDKKQFSIFREAQDLETLSVSDISGFIISIPKVNGKGQYKADAIIFNHPEIADCMGQQCMDINVIVDEFTKPGDPVKIRLDGKIGNKKIYGEFSNILKN